MSRFDAETARCTIFTYKEGLLSPIAHDLKIAVTRFSIDVQKGEDGSFALQGEFSPGSLRVVTAMRDGSEAPQLLGESDRRKIEGNIANDVLEAAKYPQVRFSANGLRASEPGSVVALRGELSLHGKTRPLEIKVATKADVFVGVAELHQPDFGIKPYSALLGTLRIKPDLRVEIELPRSAAD